MGTLSAQGGSVRVAELRRWQRRLRVSDETMTRLRSAGVLPRTTPNGKYAPSYAVDQLRALGTLRASASQLDQVRAARLLGNVSALRLWLTWTRGLPLADWRPWRADRLADLDTVLACTPEWYRHLDDERAGPAQTIDGVVELDLARRRRRKLPTLVDGRRVRRREDRVDALAFVGLVAVGEAPALDDEHENGETYRCLMDRVFGLAVNDEHVPALSVFGARGALAAWDPTSVEDLQLFAVFRNEAGRARRLMAPGTRRVLVSMHQELTRLLGPERVVGSLVAYWFGSFLTLLRGTPSEGAADPR